MKTIVLTTNNGHAAFNILYSVLEYRGTDAQILAQFRRQADQGIGRRADDMAWLAGTYGLDVKFHWTDQQALNFETWHGPLSRVQAAQEAPTYDAQALADVLFVGGTAWQFVPGGYDTPEALKVRTQVAQIVLGHFDPETPAQSVDWAPMPSDPRALSDLLAGLDRHRDQVLANLRTYADRLARMTDPDDLRGAAQAAQQAVQALESLRDHRAAVQAALAQASPLVLEQDQPSGWWYVRHVQTGGHAGHFQTKAQAQRVLDYLVQAVPYGDWDTARWAGPSSPLASVLDAIKASRSI